jgi:hypothetical protein
VHPVLQEKCAVCHNEQHDGPFQLVPIKTRVDQTPDALRANLDATLQLVDPENPAKSELLTSTLRLHGNGPRKRPIFPGSNDRSYQILASWANSLRAPNGQHEAVAGPAKRRPAISEEEIFAADRERIANEGRDRGAASMAAGQSRNQRAAPITDPGIIPPPLRYRGDVDLSTRQPNPDPRELEFPLPPVIGGFNLPTLPGRDGATKGTTNPPGASTKAAPVAAKSAVQPLAASPAGASAKQGSATPGSRTQAPDPAASGAAPPKASTPAKPVKIDPKLLEQLLKRNSGG